MVNCRPGSQPNKWTGSIRTCSPGWAEDVATSRFVAGWLVTDERSREEQTVTDERSREEQTVTDERSREEQTVTDERSREERMSLCQNIGSARPDREEQPW
jgi:hypothetical protein